MVLRRVGERPWSSLSSLDLQAPEPYAPGTERHKADVAAVQCGIAHLAHLAVIDEQGDLVTFAFHC